MSIDGPVEQLGNVRAALERGDTDVDNNLITIDDAVHELDEYIAQMPQAGNELPIVVLEVDIHRVQLDDIKEFLRLVATGSQGLEVDTIVIGYLKIEDIEDPEGEKSREYKELTSKGRLDDVTTRVPHYAYRPHQTLFYSLSVNKEENMRRAFVKIDKELERRRRLKKAEAEFQLAGDWVIDIPVTTHPEDELEAAFAQVTGDLNAAAADAIAVQRRSSSGPLNAAHPDWPTSQLPKPAPAAKEDHDQAAQHTGEFFRQLTGVSCTIAHELTKEENAQLQIFILLVHRDFHSVSVAETFKEIIFADSTKVLDPLEESESSLADPREIFIYDFKKTLEGNKALFEEKIRAKEAQAQVQEPIQMAAFAQPIATSVDRDSLPRVVTRPASEPLTRPQRSRGRRYLPFTAPTLLVAGGLVLTSLRTGQQPVPGHTAADTLPVLSSKREKKVPLPLDCGFSLSVGGTTIDAACTDPSGKMDPASLRGTVTDKNNLMLSATIDGAPCTAEPAVSPSSITGPVRESVIFTCKTE